jgi:hypothetical protein
MHNNSVAGGHSPDLVSTIEVDRNRRYQARSLLCRTEIKNEGLHPRHSEIGPHVVEDADGWNSSAVVVFGDTHRLHEHGSGARAKRFDEDHRIQCDVPVAAMLTRQSISMRQYRTRQIDRLDEYVAIRIGSPRLDSACPTA